MHILVYEYLTGGGHGHTYPASMRLEGERMVEALVSDLIAIPGVSITLLWDVTHPFLPVSSDRIRRIPVAPSEDPLEVIQNTLSDVDAVWPVAPETNGTLERICRMIEDHHKTLLNADASSVSLTASKQRTHDALKHAGIPVVPTRPVEAIAKWSEVPYPCVLKMDDGAGCEDTIIVRERTSVEDCRINHPSGSWVVQPLIEGSALSLSGLFFKGSAQLLCCNHQHIQIDQDRFHLTGIKVNAESDSDGTMARLLSAIARAIPGLWGFAGVDLMLMESGPVVLEINPRLTSAYPGIHDAIGLNPAALVLDLMAHQRLPAWTSQKNRSIEVDWSPHS